jgi:hypothetical protein
MNRVSDQRSLTAEIVAIDRRNPKKSNTSKHKIILVSKAKESIVFLADSQFPVPACKRRYFLGKRELVLEESGTVPDRNLFQFSGVFIKRSTVLNLGG